ncbi:hypothetical protein MNBD_GAMMA22-2653 [hydrothermal vent metagenome]|uniref:Uncharacterized protein n=1 Tax=hydrothermal vent metagenome TaxID=652676 RepID=A0A3B0ZUS6_9ZZZZ
MPLTKPYRLILLRNNSVASYLDWHIPLSINNFTLRQALKSLSSVQAEQKDIPLMVQLVENPKFRFPGFEFFHGAVDLRQHDCIHILLGRGLTSIDEAFVIGFTMGTTNKVSTTEERLYGLIAQYFYPSVYQFGESDIEVFKNAVRLGYISCCQALDTVDFNQYLDNDIQSIRQSLSLEIDLLSAYYKIEQQRNSDNPACQRLLNTNSISSNSV